MTHGIRKVNEYLISNGRALIFTDNIDFSSDIDIWNSIANGSIYVNPEEGTLKYKNFNSQKGIWSMFKAPNILMENSITNNLILDYELDSEKFSTGAVDNRVLGTYAVTSDKIMNESIIEKNIAQNSMTGKILIDNSVSGSKIVDYSLDGSKIVQRSVDKFAIMINTLTGDEIKDNSIPSYKLISVDGSIVEENSLDGISIKDNSVDGKKIISGTITNAKLGQKCVSNYNMDKDSVGFDNIIDNSITENKYANLSIGNSKIKDNTIENSKIRDYEIQGNKIAYGTINKENLNSDIQNILNNAITYENGIAKIKGNMEVVGNIHAISNDCSQTITGFKVFNPVFKDFAEAFEYEGKLEYGDIVEITENGKVKRAKYNSSKLIGVVSNSYAFCLGATKEELDKKEKMPIGLLGRVSINIIGEVSAGDFIICNGNGIGKAIKSSCSQFTGSIVGRALESNNNRSIKKVLCLVHVL